MVIKIPATSANLGPGFDALGIGIDMFNTVEITKQKLFSISLNGEGSDKIKLRKNNSFVTIFKEVYSKLTDDKNQNFRFVFDNKIPFSRGLGSSSAVVVGAVASAFYMSGFKIERNKILNMALEYENHPDNIAPATFGGFVSSIVENKTVYSQKAYIDNNIKAVVVIPNQPMSTAQSRLKLPKNYTMAQAVSNLSHAAFLTACFIKQDYDMLKIASKDMMHENFRMQLLPELFKVRELAYDNGALMSTLSGSGSTFLNLVYRYDAEKLRDILNSHFPSFRVEILNLNNDGFEIIKS